MFSIIVGFIVACFIISILEVILKLTVKVAILAIEFLLGICLLWILGKIVLLFVGLLILFTFFA